MAATQTLINGSTRVKYDLKETASMIRRALASAFPGVTFSVRTKRASMYQATEITWTDGPTRQEVEHVTNQFTSQGFDGMTDATTYHQQMLNGEPVSFTGWVNVSRHTSDQLRAVAERMAAARGCDVWPILDKLRPEGVLVTMKAVR